MATRLRILLAIGSDSVAARLGRAWQGHVLVERCTKVADAIRFLDENGELPLVFESDLPDGAGLDVLSRARLLDPRVDALLVGQPALSGLATTHGVHFLSATSDGREYVAALQAFLAKEETRHHRISGVVERWSESYKLTASEQRVLAAAAVDGIPRRSLSSALDKSDETIKAHVRSLLKRTGRRSLSDIISSLLRHALRS